MLRALLGNGSSIPVHVPLDKVSKTSGFSLSAVEVYQPAATQAVVLGHDTLDRAEGDLALLGNGGSVPVQVPLDRVSTSGS